MRLSKRMLAITAALCASLVGTGSFAAPALAQTPEEGQIETQAQTKSAYDFFKAQGSNVAAGILNGTVGPRKMQDGTNLHSYTHLGDPDDATALANMLESLDILEEMNKVRTQVEHISELKVTDTAMAYTMLAANWSNHSYETGNGLQHSNPYALSNTMRWGNSRGEVIARGYRDARHVIGGWYWAEKAYATGTSQTDLYGTRYSTTENRQTGHYKIIRDNTYKIAGAAIVSSNKIHAVDFADVNRLLGAGSYTGTVSGEKTYTVAQYRARLQSYIDQIGGIDEPEPDVPDTPDEPDNPVDGPEVILDITGQGGLLTSDGGPGDIISIEPVIFDEYILASISATSEGKSVPLTYDAATGNYLMLMPNADVTVSVVYKWVGLDADKKHSITVQIEGVEGGDVSMPYRALPGTSVSGGIMPNDGWWLYSATAEAGGRELNFYREEGTNSWRFVMPDEDVVIHVVFMPDGEEPEPEEPKPEEPEPEEPGEIPEPEPPVENEGDDDDTDTGFSDVSSTEWYAKSIAWAVENKAMGGYSGTDKFGPNDKLTRAQMAEILWNLEGKPAVSLGDGMASDVSADKWYASSTSWCMQTGIFAGYGNGAFGPEDTLTREQAAVVLWRRAGEPASSQNLSGFPDAGDTSTYAIDAMRWAVENGVLSGADQDDGAKKLNPRVQCTRAELATILMRMDEDGIL